MKEIKAIIQPANAGCGDTRAEANSGFAGNHRFRSEGIWPQPRGRCSRQSDRGRQRLRKEDQAGNRGSGCDCSNGPSRRSRPMPIAESPAMERFLFLPWTTSSRSEPENAATMPSEGHVQNLTFKIHGMDCAEEIAVLKQEIGPIVGGADNLTFDLLRGKMTVLNTQRLRLM